MKKFRWLLITSGVVMLYGVLFVRLYKLQISKSEYYTERAEALGKIGADSMYKRGRILIQDKNGNEIPLAVNKEYPVIYAVPKDIDDAKEEASALSEILGWEKEELEKALDNPESRFRMLVEKASEEQIEKVQELKLKGIFIDKKPYRSYSFEKLASHVAGFVGINKEYKNPKGLYGIEKQYEETLRAGEDVKLTIDRNIQTEAEEMIQGLVKAYGAKTGTIIVEDPKTGAILALANAPNFNPNTYGESPVENFINPATQNLYEPGSVFKPITMAAGIDTGVITPLTTYVDKGTLTINGEKISNWDLKAHGRITMTNVIEQSVNTGAVFAAVKTGKEHFVEYVKKFGFGEKTEIELPDEVRGNLSNIERKNVQDIDIATASFGQGTAVTPIQMISAFTAIANGGALMRPHIDASVPTKEVRRVIKEETAKKVAEMMESAVEKANVAALPQHRIAGKTGTAQIADLKYGGYEEAYNHTFIGFGPISNPKFVALLKLERPNVTLAGATVVPAFKKLAQFIVSYYNIPPDKATE